MSNKIVRIYIPLLNEGTPVVRATDGEVVRDNIFRVLPINNSNTEGWEFPPGTIVKCVKEVWSGNEILVARETYKYLD
jgi:hypothetical protein